MKQKLLFIFALLCMVAQGAWSQNVVDLSTISSDYEAQDGDVLTGNLASPYNVIIHDKATVTLSGVSIKWNENTEKHCTSSIKCLGDAEIILAEGTTNEIYPLDCPGIWVGPEGTTTTIKGTGSIKVKVLWYAYPGIGGYENCGNIVIENGIIETEGGWDSDNKKSLGAPGIGAAPYFTCGDITILGGKITSNGGRFGAGIGRGRGGKYHDTECGTIKILGGEVHAFGGSLAAGIGGGPYTDGFVTLIDGGVVYAYGGEEGAGIGGGGSDAWDLNGGQGNNITIKSGTIEAKGGTDAAGIGGGQGGTGGNIFIYGGDITATGGAYGAGIGGGNGARGGAIWITGGTVKAYGGTDAAGIGGGEDGDSGSIVINDGNVYASGDGYGVGIGAGEDGDVDNTISINGGTVEAFGGDDINRAIGGEDDEDYSNISIDSKMKVTDASTFGSTLSFAIRGLLLSSYYHLKFEPCDHAGQTLSYAYVDENKHKFFCQWCGWHEEEHTGEFSCNKCNYEGTPHYAHYYEMVYNEQEQKYEYQEVASEIFKNNLILPELKSPLPTERVFVGWVAGAPGDNDDGLLKDDEDTAYNILYTPGQGLSADGDVYFKARYVNKTLDLATVTSDQTVYDGVVVTGTLDTENHPVKITIANNATVTLSGATINGVNNSSYKWAGINCKGNATIILADGTTNTVKGFYEDYPGIYVPQNYSLTIKGETAGTGSLNASSNDFGAGIGGGYCGASCGVISINGGNITATGGKYCAGIGSSHNNSCSHILINGGTIHATGGENAAGIGSGWGGTNAGDFSSCGMINILSDVTSVTATKGAGAPNSIGAGYQGTCSVVVIGSKVGAVERSPYFYFPLADASDNSSKITAFSNEVCDVTLKGRTLYKDGAWNTLCLPFNVTIVNSPLAGDDVTVMELDGTTSGLDSEGLLTINFTEVTSGTLTAGKPYIIKWDNTGAEITNPVFSGVTVTNTDPATQAVSFSNAFGDNGQFVGSYSPLSIDDANIDEIIYLGADNTLGYASSARTLRSFRAHFVVPTTSTSGARAMTRSIVNFGDGDTTSLSEKGIVNSKKCTTAAEWYSLDGRRLSGKPTQKGVYINNGKKVIIK